MQGRVSWKKVNVDIIKMSNLNIDKTHIYRSLNLANKCAVLYNFYAFWLWDINSQLTSFMLEEHVRPLTFCLVHFRVVELLVSFCF